MPYSPVDPSSLEGDELKRWYQRSPAEIEQERQAARTQQYNDFFGGLRTSQPTVDNSSQSAQSTGTSPGLDVASSGQWPGITTPTFGDAYFDTTDAGPDDGGYLSPVGNPANPRLRREWEQKWGLPWPKDPVTGRNYDVAHIIAKADGGKDHVDNIRPMPRDPHMAEHMANGDLARWAQRPGIARAFGGRVGSTLGPLSIFSDILGMISGRVRTDTPDNMWSDMVGVPSQEDQRKALEQQQKAINPKWKPGDPVVFET